jgi:hypothetical protein
MSTPAEHAGPRPKRPQRIIATGGIVLFLFFFIHAAFSSHTVARQLTRGDEAPPFAVPLALSSLSGDANVATHADDGQAGLRPACAVRGPQVLNVCELTETSPAVLALFVNSSGCSGVLGTLQQLSRSFPRVSFAAVEIRGNRTSLRKLVRSSGATFPVGYDHDGALASLYRVVSCPQVNLISAGGKIAAEPLHGLPSLATLRARVTALSHEPRHP